MFILTKQGYGINTDYIKSITYGYHADQSEAAPWLVSAWGTDVGEQYQLRYFGTDQKAREYIAELTQEITNG